VLVFELKVQALNESPEDRQQLTRMRIATLLRSGINDPFSPQSCWWMRRLCTWAVTAVEREQSSQAGDQYQPPTTYWHGM